MGKRREPRKLMERQVRIFGTDSGGKIFSESVTTSDVSQNGAKLCGVRAKLNLDEIVGVSYGKNKVHFRVKWVAESPNGSQVGLLNLTPEKPFWDFPVPCGATDNFRPSAERRQSPRVKCSISVELRPFRAACDLGQGLRLQPGRLLRGDAHSATAGKRV